MAKTILIIEDEASIQNIVRAFLEGAGYTVYAAAPVLVRVLPHLFCPPPYTMDGGFSISKDRREPRAPAKNF